MTFNAGTFSYLVDVICVVFIGLWLADRVYEWAHVAALRIEMVGL